MSDKPSPWTPAVILAMGVGAAAVGLAVYGAVTGTLDPMGLLAFAAGLMGAE